MPEYEWTHEIDGVDWEELSDLYRVAPLGDKPPDALRTVFGNSMFRCFAYADGKLVGAGRALADGLDCAYIGDVAVRPEHQGEGLGKEIMRRLVTQASGHRKIILYANPGKEGFYLKLGFLPMTTAMGMWQDQAAGIAAGVLNGSAAQTPDEGG